jgi:hypothetical protein
MIQQAIPLENTAAAIKDFSFTVTIHNISQLTVGAETLLVLFTFLLSL